MYVLYRFTVSIWFCRYAAPPFPLCRYTKFRRIFCTVWRCAWALVLVSQKHRPSMDETQAMCVDDDGWRWYWGCIEMTSRCTFFWVVDVRQRLGMNRPHDRVTCATCVTCVTCLFPFRRQVGQVKLTETSIEAQALRTMHENITVTDMKCLVPIFEDTMIMREGNT